MRSDSIILQFKKTVEEGFKDENDKYEFWKIVKDYQAQRIDIMVAIGRLKELFRGHPKLISSFNAFLPIELAADELQPNKPLIQIDQALNFVKKIKARFGDNEQGYRTFLEILNQYENASKTPRDVCKEVVFLFQDYPDLLYEFNSFLPEANQISEVCTPSYRLLPANYSVPISSYRTKLGDSVLNNSCTFGPTTGRSKHRRWSPYEENLFNWEDNRFETDMFLESAASSARQVSELIQKLQDSNLQKDIKIDDFLSVRTMRCIEKLYEDQGPATLDLLRKYPARELPVVHSRLVQKIEELSERQNNLKNV